MNALFIIAGIAVLVVALPRAIQLPLTTVPGLLWSAGTIAGGVLLFQGLGV